jgi:glycosyltransferase involved in cell wall biosynthesis
MVGPDKDGTFSKVKDKVTQLNLENHVELFLRLPFQDWILLAKNCTVFLNTTKVDNTPVSLIEAMALGFPIVTTEVGGIPYLIEDQEEGFLFPSGNASEGAARIFRIHQSAELWQKSSDLAIRKAKTMDWETTVKAQWEKILKKDA